MALDAGNPDDSDGPTVLEEAFTLYQEDGLRLPPVPRNLVSELDEFADWRWGSDDLNLEDRDGFLAAAMAPGGEDAVAFGHAGHGVSSWWLCYRLQQEAVALFVRVAYGGAYDDPVSSVASFNRIAEAMEDFIPAAAAAKAAGRFGGGHRIVAVLDEKGESFWQVAGGPDGPQETDDPLEEAMAFLQQPALPGSVDDP